MASNTAGFTGIHSSEAFRDHLLISQADLQDEDDMAAIVALTEAYALDPMGLGEPLPEQISARLPETLRSVPGAIVLLARWSGKPVGIATCFTGFSTFMATPLINIHDIAVLPEVRSKGVGSALLKAVEAAAREMGCGKVTLEVREDNAARRVYERAGFEYGEPKMYFMTLKVGARAGGKDG
jgi:ribosomal protein S18 acetylase RimI-like enzyme